MKTILGLLVLAFAACAAPTSIVSATDAVFRSEGGVPERDQWTNVVQKLVPLHTQRIEAKTKFGALIALQQHGYDVRVRSEDLADFVEIQPRRVARGLILMCTYKNGTLESMRTMFVLDPVIRTPDNRARDGELDVLRERAR